MVKSLDAARYDGETKSMEDITFYYSPPICDYLGHPFEGQHYHQMSSVTRTTAVTPVVMPQRAPVYPKGTS